jgi:hypothetical protein
MVEPVELMGGESVYCINESQLKTAYKMAEEKEGSKDKIQEQLKIIQEGLTRNEQASLAFVLIDKLLKTTQ